MGVSFRLDRRPSFRVPIYGGEEALFLRAYQQLEKRFEELRVLRGTRAGPVTVAPSRAWRGSQGLVARSPKFHTSAGIFSRTRESSIAACTRENHRHGFAQAGRSMNTQRQKRGEIPRPHKSGLGMTT